MREAIEFLEKINPSFKNQDITKINTFGGEFLIYCVQKALNSSLQFNVKGEDLKIVMDTLEKHNEWRRDKNVPSKTKMISPKELGEAIDKAIEILKNLK